MIQNLWHNNFVTMLRHFYVVANEVAKFGLYPRRNKKKLNNKYLVAQQVYKIRLCTQQYNTISVSVRVQR